MDADAAQRNTAAENETHLRETASLGDLNQAAAFRERGNTEHQH